MQSALTQEYTVPHTDCLTLTIEIDRPRGSAEDSATRGKPVNRKMSFVTKSEQWKRPLNGGLGCGNAMCRAVDSEWFRSGRFREKVNPNEKKTWVAQ
jgi:hypothetical protein